MVRRYSWLALVVVLVLGAAPLRASSVPPLQGQFAGIELCEQAVCGSAIFVGLYSGQVGFIPHAIGTISVAVRHNPLPPPYTPADIIGGSWQLKLLNGAILGGPICSGSLYNKNDGTFHVIVNMAVGSCATGTATFDGTLSHNTFPPTIWGNITP